MSAIVIPFLEDFGSPLRDPASRIGPIVLSQPPPIVKRGTKYYVLVESTVSLTTLSAWLDGGVEKVIIPLNLAKEIIGVFPAERLIVTLDVSGVSAVSDKLRSGVSGVLLKAATIDLELISSVARFFNGGEILVSLTSTKLPTINLIADLKRRGAILVVPSTRLTLDSASSAEQINLIEAFTAPLISDRSDGLYPTVVSSATHGDRTLGLVYSSKESIAESIKTGRGVYQSRKHGLWRKGETSGSTQEVVRISVDCDTDSLQFSVIQHGSGFCHLGSASCFGSLAGLAALEQTLHTRLESAPEGSYTKRLFEDPDLLHSKIMEEADELCRANNKEDIAFEAADLFYFALTKCIANGVSLADIEHSLDKKARKVTRRPGNAKPQWEKSASVQSSSAVDFRMRLVQYGSASAEERSRLLKRPVLKFDEMMTKVRPIVDEVRQRGDKALIDFAAKFDKAQLSETVIRSPFNIESLSLQKDLRDAIDQAYVNIKRFHQAQTTDDALVVETMPGVVCSRFARPISRVGLYVPGGTAVLPSTALMLGVPAQVAGCHQIILASPPRPDGSISPEVMYVAHLVGASAILKAGGSQAIAALAYGTESVPKVDKIFGPGNQWVTAAKMLVQNDTDALVSIDMPAGPSEVLVIADDSANPAFVAADLLSQAEHGVDSQVVLVVINPIQDRLRHIEDEIEKQARALPRVEIVRDSVRKSLIVQVASVEEAFEFSNAYAPEHLILNLKDANEKVGLVQNAGSVFVGPYSPESCGDYASGTNHTLPTNGYARQFSGINTLSFQKHITSQEISKAGLDKLGPVVVRLAECEGLEAHANAVRIRLKAT